MKTRAKSEKTALSAPVERTKVVYTQPPISLAPLLSESQDEWHIELAGVERSVSCAPDVDRALLREVVARKGRVLIEIVDGEPRIAGVLQTRRGLEVDQNGDVLAELRSLRVKVTEEIQLSTARAFIALKRDDIEIYGKEVLTRAREVAKILGRLISLN